MESKGEFFREKIFLQFGNIKFTLENSTCLSIICQIKLIWW
jgi:hypothetical protein